MDLISRLESAEVGSRELSDEVLLAAGWEITTWKGAWNNYQEETVWVHPKGAGYASFKEDDRPDPTRNVQDAIDWLVPEGWWWELNPEHALLGPPNSCDCCYDKHKHGDAATLPLAMCAAAKKAMEIEK